MYTVQKYTKPDRTGLTSLSKKHETISAHSDGDPCYRVELTILFQKNPRDLLKATKYPLVVSGSTIFCQVALLCLVVRQTDTKNGNEDQILVTYTDVFRV